MATGLPAWRTRKSILLPKSWQSKNLHPDVREMLELLVSEGGSAPLKAQALLDRHVGGWYKDATRYFGARSGRGTSEGANMFNIARPSGKYNGKDGRASIDQIIAGLKAGFKYDNTALTDSLRGCVVAPAGYLVCDNDLANAEYRIAMWMAGDQERLNLLAQSKDLYMYNSIRIFNLPETADRKSHPKERHEWKAANFGRQLSIGLENLHGASAPFRQQCGQDQSPIRY